MIKIIQQNINLIKSFSGYTLANILNASIPFLLFPILTSYLDLESFGILSNFNSLVSVLVPLVGINVTAIISKQYFNKDIDLKSYISSCVKTIGLNFIILSLLVFLVADTITNITSIPQKYIVVVPFYAFLNNVIEILLTIIRMKDKPVLFGLFRMFRTSIELGLTLLLIIFYDYSWEAQLIGMLTAGSVGAIISFYALYKYEVFGMFTKFNKKYVKNYLNFGIPLIPHALSGTIILYSDKIVITNMIGIEENGLYSAAFQIGMIIALFQNSFNQAWVPWFYKQLSESFNKIKIVKITYIYCAILLGLVFVLWLFTPFIFSLLNTNYKGGMPFVFWIGLGFAFNGMYKMMVNYLFYLELTKQIAYTTFSIALCNVVLNIVLINSMGLIGAAIASTISFGLQFLAVWYISNKYFPMPWFSFLKGNQ